MSDQIFRQEALDAKRTDMLGAVIIAQPPGVMLLTIVVAIFMVAIGTLFFGFSYTSKITVHGYLAIGQDHAATVVPAPADGADNTLIAQLYIPASVIEAVHIGDPLRLKLQTAPRHRLGHIQGTISAIAKPALNRQAPAEVAAARTAEPLYRIDVKLAAAAPGAVRQAALLPGMAVGAEIALETRPLYSWAVQPLRERFGEN